VGQRNDIQTRKSGIFYVALTEENLRPKFRIHYFHWNVCGSIRITGDRMYVDFF